MKIPSAWFGGRGTAPAPHAGARSGTASAASALVAAILLAECSSAPRAGTDSAVPAIVNHEEIQQARRHEYRATGMMVQGVADTTMVEILVNTLGGVEDVKVAVSSGNDTVDQAALRVAQVHRFEPARNKGKAVSVWVSRSVVFEPGLCDMQPLPNTVFMVENLNAGDRRGETTVALLVDLRGRVREAKIESGSGWDRFDRAALETARKSRFHPGMTNCEPAEKWTTMMFALGRNHSGT